LVEDKEEVVVKQEGADMVVKKEDNSTWTFLASTILSTAGHD
jgi:hypothetical protein